MRPPGGGRGVQTKVKGVWRGFLVHHIWGHVGGGLRLRTMFKNPSFYLFKKCLKILIKFKASEAGALGTVTEIPDRHPWATPRNSLK